MVANKKVSGKTMSMPGGIAVGALLSIAVTLTGAAVLAKLIEGEAVTGTGIGYGVMLILVAASVGGALLAYSRIRRRRMLVCVLTGVFYLLSLLGGTALFFGGQYTGIPVTALVILGGAAAAGLLGMYAGGSKKSPAHKRAYR